MRRYIILFLVAIAYFFFRLVSRKKPDPDMGWRHFSRVQKKKDRFAAGGQMVKDPQCDTYVPREKAIQVGDEYFCSEECATQWEARKNIQ